MKKVIIFLLVAMLMVAGVTGCSSAPKEETIMLAAAASLKNCMENELIPMFEQKNSNIKVNGTYDSSGKLQTQIEEGADVDVFMSAAEKQMNALNDKGMIADNSIVPLLENELVLIVPKGNENNIQDFNDILNAEIIAVGDPESVPAGQYAKELLSNLGLWDEVSEKSSQGTNVTEVLNWVAEGSADAGIVYATDAISNDKVEIVVAAPEGTVSKVIYPVGIIKATTKSESAKAFVDFLQSDDAKAVFEKYGFKAN